MVFTPPQPRQIQLLARRVAGLRPFDAMDGINDAYRDVLAACRRPAIRSAKVAQTRKRYSVHRAIINLLQQSPPQHYSARQIGQSTPGSHQHAAQTLVFQCLEAEGAQTQLCGIDELGRHQQ